MMSESETRDLLQEIQTIAVVGMSENPMRDSNAIARFLKRNGYRVIPVNPNLHGLAIGERAYASLMEVPEPIDMVVIFRRPEFTGTVVEDAICLGVRAIWMQPGAGNAAAATRAQLAGIQVAVDRCVAVEHRRLMRDVELMYA